MRTLHIYHTNFVCMSMCVSACVSIEVSGYVYVCACLCSGQFTREGH